MCVKDMTRGGETRTCLAGIIGRRGKPGDAEARHIVSRGLLCKDPAAALLADVEHRLAAARSKASSDAEVVAAGEAVAAFVCR